MNVGQLMVMLATMIHEGQITDDTMVVVDGYEGDLDDPDIRVTVCSPNHGMGANGPSYFGKHEESPSSGNPTVPCLLIGR